MGNELTMEETALVQAAVDEANAAMGRALAVIENVAARLCADAPRPCGGCQGEDFGDCPGCGRAADGAWRPGGEPCEPSGRVYGGGGHGQDS